MARSIAAAFAKATVTSLSFPLRHPALLLPPPSPPLKSLSFPVLNPATGSTIAYVEDRSKDASKSIALARNAFEVGNWRDTSGVYRSKLLNRWSMLIEENKDDLAAIMSMCEVNRKSRIWNMETFGPVAAISQFSDDDDAISTANDTRYGLATYVMTKDMNRVFNLAKRLDNGLLGINEGVISSAYAPFGGVKESGIGREGSSIGIDEYVETKYVFINH
mmetsp:Transcript_9617/g.12470  ORF Transcript_9617/g.12470 Transcript_9617/m.12470 type:complete len:219 (-) Transcript_9617:1074-1730(-)